MSTGVRIGMVPARELAVTLDHGPASDIGRIVSAAFGTVAEHIARAGGRPHGPAVARFTMCADGTFDVAAGFPVDEAFTGDGVVEPLTLPATEVATTTFVGPYAELPRAYERLRSEVAAMGRRLDDSAPMWEEYWSEPTAAPADTRTEVFWPVVPA
ncbi:MAG: GyrI-like domain-containing protein [Chloroflexota bacterium]